MVLELRVRVIDDSARAITNVETITEDSNHEIKDGLHPIAAEIDLVEGFSRQSKSIEIVFVLFVLADDSVSLFAHQRSDEGQGACLKDSSQPEDVSANSELFVDFIFDLFRVFEAILEALHESVLLMVIALLELGRSRPNNRITCHVI